MIIPTNEIVTFVLGLSVLAFLVTAQSRLREFPAWRTFVFSLSAYVAAWLCNILDGVWGHTAHPVELEGLFNALEHIGYCLGALAFTVWCWRGLAAEKRAGS